jgi:hypothetical protein
VRRRFILLFVALIASMPSFAEAAIYKYGCLGSLGDQQIILDGDALYILKAGVRASKPLKFSVENFGDAIAAAKTSKDLDETYESADSGGFDATMNFKRTDDEAHRVTLTEKSTRRVSHRHRIICWRSEDTDVYRKTYRYERGQEPARDITMQCYEYQLSTKGGHEGCD